MNNVINTGPINATAEGNRVVAMFHNYEDAAAARDALIAAGIDRGRIDIVAQSSPDPAIAPAPGGEGLWASIKRFLMPEEDSRFYAEGVRRGYVMLGVSAGASDREVIIGLLDRHNPIDVETEAADWRAGGWGGSDVAAAGSRGTPPMTAPYPVGTSPVLGPTGAPVLGEEIAAARTGIDRPAVVTAGTTTTDTPAAVAADVVPGRGAEQVVPIYEERLRVGKREIGRGNVRVRSYVVEEPVEEQVRLREERVDIEHRPVDRPAEPGTFGAEPFRERTIEVTATAEEAVVDKDTRLKEEIVVRKEAEERVETIRDTLRRTEVDVEDDREASRSKH